VWIPIVAVCLLIIGIWVNPVVAIGLFLAVALADLYHAAMRKMSR
jgi:hypothetical protein